MEELKQIFEHEIKRKLSERSRSSADEYRILMNCFKFYDYAYTGKVNETEFVKSILRTGLSGFNESDIRSLFKNYDKNNAGQIDYKNFCGYLCGREELKPLPGQQNEQSKEIQSKNIDINNNINNQQLNEKTKTPLQNPKTPLIQKENNTNQIPDEQQIKPNLIEETKPPVAKQENKDTSQQAKEYFQKLVNSLKEQINTNNGITYYTFLYELKNGSDENNQLPIDTLINAFKSIGLNIPQNDLNNFFNLLDFSGTGKISLDDIMNTIADPILDHRKYYIVNKFAKLDTEKKGDVLISLLKEKYNPRGHPDVIAGKMSEEESFKQFCYTLDIYCGIRMLKDVINYKQFLEYYSGISSSILDENYFIDILNGVWDNDNNLNNNNIQQNPIQNINPNKNINNLANQNPGYQPNINKRYNKQRMNENIPNKYNDSYADSNLGINSLLLGESSHILPKSFGKKNFKKYRTNFSQQDLNNINQNNNIKANEQNNNNINSQEDIVQNNYNRPNCNKSSKFESTDLNQLGELNNNLNRYNRNNRNNKFSYNPITNEYTPVNVSNINIKNIKIKTPINQEVPQINKEENKIVDKEQLTINSLNKLKSIFYTKGPNFIFSFQRKLSLYDFNHTSMISLENFLYISSSFNINISLEELELIFNFFDKENTGSINYNILIQTIIGQINPNRETILKNIYSNFKKDNNGNVSLSEIKILFNASKHPDVLNGQKSRGQVYGEFLDNIQTFKEYLENMRGIYTNNFSYEDFVNFYQIIGVGIDDDKLFEFMVNNCWTSDNGEIKDENGNYGNKYNNGGAYANNNFSGRSQGNLMARAGSQIINNKF